MFQLILTLLRHIFPHKTQDQLLTILSLRFRHVPIDEYEFLFHSDEGVEMLEKNDKKEVTCTNPCIIYSC